MIKISILKDLNSIVRKYKSEDKENFAVDILSEETIDQVFDALPKLLDLYDATQVTYHGVHDMKDCAICKALKEFEK